MVGEIAARLIGVDREEAVCPFCAAPWSEAMVAALDRATLASGCACCGGAVATHLALASRPFAVPAEGVRCATCGRELYRAVEQVR